MTLAERAALVTGGSRGIGLATAFCLARLGARVAICSRDGTAVQQAARQVEQATGRDVVALTGDVAEPGVAEELVRQVVDRLGRLDVLVNNAGIHRDTLLARMSDQDWAEVLRINLEGVFRMSRAALRPMLRQRYGRIVNVTSVAGLIGNPGQTNYAAAKAGIVGFTRSLAREVASRQITVNAIAPGFVATAMTQQMTPKEQALVGQIPMGRLGQPEEVAWAIAFLASDEASYITGHVLVVDGGLSMAG